MTSFMFKDEQPEHTTSKPDLQLSVNGKYVQVSVGATILDALHACGVSIPSLCHDPRLKPVGACRLCFVEIEGQSSPVTACNTTAVSGMQVLTETPALLNYRESMLRLLAANYPADAKAPSDSELSNWLQHFGITAEGTHHVDIDDSNPYIQVDMSQCILCMRCVRICDEVQGQFVWNIRNRAHDTCIVPDGSSLGTSSCVTCGACVDTCPTGALQDKNRLKAEEPTSWTRTTCPYCGTGCELYAGTRDERLVAIRPALDGPVNRGHLCSKGRYAFDFVHAPERITNPMLRKNGEWHAVSWDQAIAATAMALENSIQKYGPDSVGMLGSARATNEEAYLAQKFARLVLKTNNIDCCARVCHAPSAAALKQMLGTGAATNSFDDIERAKCLLICGCNPTENHPIVGARIKQAALSGARLVVIDPRKIELSKFSEIHLQIRPGTNIPLLNAMANVIVEEGLCDTRFMDDRVENWEIFRQFIREYPPSVASEICGVPSDLIRRAAIIYAKTQPSMCFHGLGVTEHTQGTEGVMCLANLAILTGNLGRPGCGINPLRGQNNVQGAAHMGCDPDLLTGSTPLEANARRIQEIWKAEIPDRKGLNLIEMMDAAENNRLKVLWSIGYDVLLTNPNTSAARRAFGKMDAVIVQDLFLNETAREFGTIFLPACSSFEKDGTFMNSERRVQRIRKALSPLGNCKPDWEILCLTAKYMGKGDYFSFASPAEIWEEVLTTWSTGRGISYQRLERGGLQWPCPDKDHPGTTILHQDEFTSGKRTALHCAEFKRSPEVVTSEYSFTLITGRTLQQFNAGTMTNHGGHRLLRPSDLIDISPADARNLEINEGDRLRLISRYGEAVLPIHVTDSVSLGELFATFHNPTSNLNRVTGPFHDPETSTPEYKLTAVRIEKLSSNKQP
jgi:formate dehydrogenase major subunit